MARVLAARGYADEAACAAFLEVKLSGLHEPGRMAGMEAAAERLLRAVRGGERIAIYGDYDVDGISATAILYHALKALDSEARITTYVPHRLEEGYGLNAAAVAALAAEHGVIVSVDCGITAAEPARAARAAGADLIITDHHTMPERECDLPEAYALVHPGLRDREGKAYPFRDLCGAGVAYKLAWRVLALAAGGGGGKVGAEHRELLVQLLALAAMGVVADVVPLVDENRVIARYGLARLKESPLPGVKELVDASGLAGENIEAADVGFKLGPRLNACGRLGHAKEAVELLTAARGERAREIARQLTRVNEERRRTERKISEHAEELARAAGMTGVERRAIVLASEAWHAGVVGICCSRLVGKFHRPTILLSRSGEGDEAVCHGSGRSVDGFNLHAALVRCKERLVSFGGHEMAAGLKLRARDLPAFVEEFVAVCNEGLAAEDLTAVHEYDAEADVREVTREAVGRLERVGPFGRGNPEVRVRVRGVLADSPRTMGEGGGHLQLTLRGGGRETLRMVGWGWAAALAAAGMEVQRGRGIEALVTPGLNRWNGTETVQGTLCDLRLMDSGGSADG